ncbi:MAG: AmmeMemoRadiSam system protein A [Candidatus Nanoarchaeia archaeon]
MMLNKEQSEKLLGIARDAINLYLSKKSYLKVQNLEPCLREHRATFVTLKIKGKLRGCIGHLHAIQDLHKDVIDNAVASAFFDPRFPELKKDELEKVHIEISILTPPVKLECKDKEDLLEKLNNKPGIILTDGYNGATFLPQVWDEIPDASEFLTHLCMKAGLPSNTWEDKAAELSIQTYTVESYEEKKK